MATRQPGIIVTQAGVSAPYAADYQMVFNSNWPSLQIAFESVVTLAFGASATIPHGLGIYPMTLCWIQFGGVSLGRISDVSGQFYGPLTDVTYQFDSTNIYLQNNSSFDSANKTYTITVRCYNLDISKAVDYTLPQPPVVKTQYDSTTGIKVVKYGLSSGSTDLRDFILHSRAQSPAVLSIVTATSVNTSAPLTGTAINYTNPATYTPWVLAFIKGPNDISKKYELLAPGSQQAGYLHKLQGAYAQIANAGGTPYGSLVVLRDPLVIATAKRIVY